MSQIHFKAPPMSRKEIADIAWRLRELAGYANDPWLDVLSMAEVVLPRTILPDLVVVSRPETEMGILHGEYDLITKTISIREDVYNGIIAGNGRDRLTLAHEIGHALLHENLNPVLHRVSSELEVPRYMQPEWQADVFAGFLLVPPNLTKNKNYTCQTASSLFGVSHQAANVNLQYSHY